MLLGVLIVVAIGAFVYQSTSGPPTAPPPMASNMGATARTPQPAGRSALPEPVKLETLESVPAEPEVGRNLFRFGAKPEPPPPVYVAPPPVPAPQPAPSPKSCVVAAARRSPARSTSPTPIHAPPPSRPPQG